MNNDTKTTIKIQMKDVSSAKRLFSILKEFERMSKFTGEIFLGNDKIGEDVKILSISHKTSSGEDVL